jgi:hypothetical protein
MSEMVVMTPGPRCSVCGCMPKVSTKEELVDSVRCVGPCVIYDAAVEAWLDENASQIAFASLNDHHLTVAEGPCQHG